MKSDRRRLQRIDDLDLNATETQTKFAQVLRDKLTVLKLVDPQLHYTSSMNILVSSQRHSHQALHCDRDPEMCLKVCQNVHNLFHRH